MPTAPPNSKAHRVVHPAYAGAVAVEVAAAAEVAAAKTPARRCARDWARVALCLVLVYVPQVVAAAGPQAPGQGDQPAVSRAQDPPAPAPERAPKSPNVLVIDVIGIERYSADEIRAVLGQTLGEPLDTERMRRGVETLWEAYRARAEVQVRTVPGGVELRVDVVEQAFDPAPRFIGHARVDLDEIFEWVGLEETSEVYLYQSARIRRQLLDGYRRKGFYFAEVDEVVRPPADGSAPDVIFEIREGPRVKIRAIAVDGNLSNPDRGALFWKRGLRVEAQVELRSPYIFGWFPKYLDDDVLQEDLIAMREVYRDRGYWDAVVEVERLEFSEDREWVTVHVAVDEGERYRITDLRIEAYERITDPAGQRRTTERPADLLLDEAELLALCEQRTGAYYTRYATDRDQRELRRRYGELGHIYHPSLSAEDRWEFLGVEPTFDVEKREVALVYRMAQGRQQFVREIRIDGNEHTRDRVVRRLITVFPGDVADLTEIDGSLRRLRSTRYFTNEFNPGDHRDPTYKFIATSDPSWKDLEFMLQEGNVVSFEFGVQASADDGLQGFVDLQFRNFDGSRWPSWSAPIDDVRNREAFHGAGQTLQVRATPGTEVTSYTLRFVEPDLFLRHIDRIGLGVGLRRTLRRYRSHDERRTGFDIDLFRQFTPDTRASLGFETTEIRVDDIDKSGEGSLVNPLSVPALLFDQAGTSRVTGISLGILLDKVDNPVSRPEGHSAGATLTLFDGAVGSDYDYAKLEANARLFGYFVGKDRGPGYRLTARGGVQVPYGDTDDVPFTERFFLGGGTLLRGFEFRGVGPDEGEYSVGGETFLAGSFEYVFPLLTQGRAGSPELFDVLRGGLFIDAGILDPEPFRADPNELRASAGVSFSFLVPIPITLSFGFPFLKEDSDRTQVFHFSIGSF